MRFGLIGDVHAEDVALASTLAFFARARVDKVLCAGDIVDGEGDVDRCCAMLREVRAVVVRGNHDRWIRTDELRTLPHAHRMTELSVETIAFLKELPSTASIEVPHGRLLLCHGVGDNDMARLLPDDQGYAISSNEDLLKILFDPTVRIMVGGHTHRPMVRRFERGGGKMALAAVNAGTLARGDEPGFAVLDLVAGRADFYRVGEEAPSRRLAL